MRQSISIALLLTACAHQPAPEPTRESVPPVRHTFLMAGNRAGAQVATRKPDGTLHYSFEFNDRGRGPRTETVMRIDANGLPVSLETTGVDYFKGAADETFVREGSTARWKNKAESGETSDPGFYVSMYGPPEELAILARALVRAGDHRLKLLPSGEASIAHVRTLDLEANGETRTVDHWAISGLGLAPIDIWLDKDGSFFGSVSSWSSTIREGWESSVQTLLQHQDESSAVRLGEIAKRNAKRYGAIAIRNARLFDAETASIRDGMTVLIRGNTIAGVGADLEIPSDAHIIDARGKSVLPGLWDMHVHMSELDGILHLAAGVTSARDLANDTDMILSLRKKIDDETILGPRLVLAGFIDGPGPYAGPSKVLVATEEEARAAIDKYVASGYEQIKIYSSVKPELVRPIVEYAHSKGLRVSGHIPAFMRAEEAVRAGYDEIQHANMLFLNFFHDVQDTRTPLRFTAVAERGATLDLASPEVQSFVRLLKEKGTVVDPTVSIFESLFTDRPGVVSSGFAAVADRLPPQVRRSLFTGGLPVPDGMDRRYRDSYDRMLQFVRVLYDAGIPIVAGTDSFPGIALHRELELYARAGIPPAKVLQLATIGAARVAKRDDRLGSIASGKLADLVIVAGDPAANIADLRNVETVIKGGVVFSSKELYREVGIQ